jgi:hypothetical protein
LKNFVDKFLRNSPFHLIWFLTRHKKKYFVMDSKFMWKFRINWTKTHIKWLDFPISNLSLPDEGYSRNSLCVLNLISTFILIGNVKIFNGVFWLFMYSLLNTDDLSTHTELFLWTGKLLFDCLHMFVEDLYFMFVSSILLLERNFDVVAQICEVCLKHLLIVKRDYLVFWFFFFFLRNPLLSIQLFSGALYFLLLFLWCVIFCLFYCEKIEVITMILKPFFFFFN